MLPGSQQQQLGCTRVAADTLSVLISIMMLLGVPMNHTLCRYWSPINFTAQAVPFADGGSADNLAITPLLRRRMARIIMLVAASDSVTDTTDAADWGGECACTSCVWMCHVC